MNDDFPWFLLAMVIIAFLRWVAMKVQGETDETEVDVREFSDNEFLEDEPGREEPITRSDPTADPNEEIRRFFETLGGSAPPEPELGAPSPPPIPSPPPLPVAAAVGPRPEPSLSADESAALKRLRIRESRAHYETQPRPPRAATSLRSLLASPEGLQTAIVLREVLGKPKSLKEMDDSPSF